MDFYQYLKLVIYDHYFLVILLFFFIFSFIKISNFKYFLFIGMNLMQYLSYFIIVNDLFFKLIDLSVISCYQNDVQIN